MCDESAAAEKRRDARYRVADTVFALLESGAERHPAQVMDVARGGVCLRYYGEKGGCRWRQLTISSFHAGCFLGQLPVEVVHEEAAGNGNAAGLRRCGLKFTSPTYTQQALWQLFIEQNANCINGPKS